MSLTSTYLRSNLNLHQILCFLCPCVSRPVLSPLEPSAWKLLLCTTSSLPGLQCLGCRSPPGFWNQQKIPESCSFLLCRYQKGMEQRIISIVKLFFHLSMTKTPIQILMNPHSLKKQTPYLQSTGKKTKICSH